MDYNNCYTQVFNSLIFDESLSVNARFVYILFASKKNMQWVWYKSNIMKVTGFGRDKVTFAINELQMAGWIKSVFARKNGRFNGLKITVNDKPATEKPLTVDTVHINKDNKNNINNKNRSNCIVSNLTKELYYKTKKMAAPNVQQTAIDVEQVQQKVQHNIIY